MVMEATPSPQSVGREFVRQYYTLLNKAPAHLHRFYNNFSSFVHGGLDAPNRESVPVIGQKQIHNRIQQLNFHDCHAKISQVDSQVTLGNGVVVQVTGELSNGGAPMRRFTQTFVLASQSPKKYYVHNDIFRYQDYIIPDEDGEGGESGQSDAEDESIQHINAVAAVAPAMSSLAAAPAVANPPPAFYGHQPLPPPAFAPPGAEPQMTSQLPAVAVTLAPPALNGHPPHTSDDVPLAQALQVSLGTPLGEQEPTEIDEVPSPEEDPTPDSSALGMGNTGYIEPAPEVPPKPKTYANLLKSGGQAAFSQPLHSIQNYQPQYQSLPVTRQYQPQPAPLAPLMNRSGGGEGVGINAGAPLSNANAVSPGSQPQRSRPSRPPRQEPQPTNNDGPNSASGGAATGGGSGSRRYSDSQQIFLGNLPHNATEDELRAMFSSFGPIAELRVHTKASMGGGGPPGTRVPPNYGFITYEDPQSVQNCFNARPLYFPPDSPDGQKLNVEEKKTRPRGGGGEGASRGPRAPRPPFARGPHPHQAYRR